MTTWLLGIIAVEGGLIARNTWRSARAVMGRGNPVWWRMVGDWVSERRPGTF